MRLAIELTLDRHVTRDTATSCAVVSAHLVQRDNELLVQVGDREHAVGRLDDQVRHECNRVCRGDEALHPPVAITFAEVLYRACALALRDDGLQVDQARNCVS